MSEWYAKLWNSILDSSLWTTGDIETKVVWITLLAMADQDGFVHAATPGIAHRAGVSLEACERAMETFQRPDPLSRSQRFEGRRVARADRDWVILNYPEFRAKVDKEAEKERKRKWWAEHRGKSPALDETSTPLDATSETRQDSTQVEVEVVKNLCGTTKTRATKNLADVQKVIASFVGGYQEAHAGDSPMIVSGKDHKIAKTLLSSGHPVKLVCLVAHWWGKSPPRSVQEPYRTFSNLPRYFDLVLRELREEGVNLDLDSPKLPIARFFSDSPAGQTPTSPVAAVSGDSR